MNFEILKDNLYYKIIRAIFAIAMIFLIVSSYFGYKVPENLAKLITFIFYIIFFVNFVLVYKNKSLFWNLLIICVSVFSIISIIF
ncbi:hypothetical protein [Anaerococcus hydrogenalis]|uniref:hypothetical protein n=1 Tax=Anaerococcus hydrogenalis TaxID=33029 RepID=UPI0029039602|nr:hypothetical protein [Anaerococcus hydrogenalis]MDU1315942.1 hypothetical protein [Anaerococcus hydrogenalis]